MTSKKTRKGISKGKQIIHKELVMRVAHYYVENEATIRDTAKVFDYSKSYIHILLKQVPKYSKAYAVKVRELSDKNSAERATRGGHATKLKYANSKSA